jgi:CubicO group peptidase (beta-lactamase class C family)
MERQQGRGEQSNTWQPSCVRGGSSLITAGGIEMWNTKNWFPVRNALVIAFTILCSCAASGIPPQTDAGELFTAFIDALNSKDDARLKEFLAKRTTGSTPVEQRWARLKGLAEMGAPFRVVKIGPIADESVRALVENRNGEELGFVMDFLKGSEPKMRSLRIASPEELDAPPPKDYSDWKDLPGLCASLRSDAQSPGMSLAVIRAGKMEQAVAGVRSSNGNDSVAADDPWSLGSIGKPICSTILGKLIEDGKLRWDLTLGEALADLPMRPGYKKVTIEQIMHHRGGIPEDLNFQRDRVLRIAAGATDPMKIRESYARDILDRDPIAGPGEKFAYSNAGYALLGVIAERAMNKPYEALVRQIVFEPLGLKHCFTGADKLPDPRPSGHVAGTRGLEPQNFSGPLEILMAPAGGGLYMSVADLARFGESHMKGLQGENGLLKAATIQRLHQGIAEESGGGRLYACGWGIESFPGIERMHTHNGSNGTFRAQLSIFPKANLVVASFVNRGGESEPSPPLQAVLAVAKRYAPDRQ